MLYWLLERVLRRGFKSKRGIVSLGQLENLAHSGTAAWVLAQEKARLEYLNSKEIYEGHRTWRAFTELMERLLQLYSTNAVVTALMNEHLLQQMLAMSEKSRQTEEVHAPRRSA